MTLYLKWQDYAPVSQPRMVANLMGTLSRRWYPVNIIGSTIYDIFNMYGQELYSASVEENQVFSDLFINTARSVPIDNRTTSKIYDNFGRLVGVGKQALQDFTHFTTGSLATESYRQQLRLLYEAAQAGTTYVGLQKVGQSYSGISPLFAPVLTQNSGWVLTTYTGSVVAAGDGFIQVDSYLPRIGNILPTNGLTFNSGDSYIVSWSKLGTNTKLVGAKDLYSGIRIWVYNSPTASIEGGSLRMSEESAITHNLRADMDPLFFYPGSASVASPFNYMAYYRPDNVLAGGTTAVTIDGTFLVSPFGYLVNHASTAATGSEFVGDVVRLPSATYKDRDWFYDWDVRVRNDARYTFAIRSYNSATIPSTVYFMDYSPMQPVQLLPQTGAMQGGHYVFDNTTSLWDVSGNRVNMFDSGISAGLGISRRDGCVGVQVDDGSLWKASVPDSAGMNITGQELTVEMWIKGINSATSASVDDITFKYSSDGLPSSPTIGSDGFMLNIDILNAALRFDIYNGALYKLESSNGSLSPYIAEAIPIYHYFVATYASGSAHLYVDGISLGLGSVLMPSNLPNVPSGVASFFINTTSNGNAVLVDELYVSNTYLTADQVLDRFNSTKPRIRRLGMNSGSVLQYHQPKVTVYASGSNEFEFHEFSLRGLPTQQWVVRNANQAELFWLPLFKSGSI